MSRWLFASAALLSLPAQAMDLCQPPRVVPGERIVLEITGAPSNARVAIVRGTGPGSTCPPALAGSCFDVAGGTLVTWLNANADGTAVLDTVLPSNLPVGMTFGIQAGVLRGRELLLSDPFFTSVQAANDPSTACSTGNICANVDADQDAVHDVCDMCPGGDDGVDGDLDAIPDACDACPLGANDVDNDMDGIPDACDTCPTGADDVDSDMDGTPDACDVCPLGADDVDTNMNGVPDACEAGPMEGLVAWWDFSQGFTDRSGNGHDATLVSGTSTQGPHGDAVTLDGTEDWLTVPSSPDFDLGPQLTIAAWVNPSTLLPYQGIFAKSSRGGATQDWGLYLRNGEIAFLSDFPALLRAHISVGANIVPGAWYHVAAVADADANFVDFYLDGSFLYRANQQLTLPMNMTDLVIGTDGGPPNDFAGSIDDVRVWSRALGEAEIRDAWLAP